MSSISSTAEALFEWLRNLAGASPSARGSMYFDLAERRRLELEAINGAVVRMGRELGVSTPLNLAVYAALEPYAQGAPTLPGGSSSCRDGRTWPR